MSVVIEDDGSNGSLENEQRCRAVLREKFLRCVSSISGEYCQVKTVELNDLTGFYHGVDIHVQNIFMKDLSTPYSNLKNGLLRTQDLLYVSFPDIGTSPKIKKEIHEPDVDSKKCDVENLTSDS